MIQTSSRWQRMAGLTIALAAAILALVLAFPLAAQAVSYSSEELAFLTQINNHRQQNGLPKLLLSNLISDASEKHSADMAKYKFFSHESVQSSYYPAGSTPWYRMAQSGYNFSTNKGENIAAGQSTGSSVFTAWKNSAGHNANMLNSSYKVIGIGLVYDAAAPYRYYWTTDFGGYADSTAHDPSTSGTPTPTTTPTTSPTPTTTPTTVAKYVPAAPASLATYATSYTAVYLKFVDKSTNERGFYLERSTNGTTWVRVKTLGARAGSGTAVYVSNYYLSRYTTYYYRVKAYNAYGVSASSNVITARTR